MSWGTMHHAVVTPPPPPTIPFNAAHAHHVPPALSFGFGCGSSWGENNAPVATESAHVLSPQGRASLSVTESPGRALESSRSQTKRRRNSLDDDAMDAGDSAAAMDDSKRRRAVRPLPADGDAAREKRAHQRTVDLGRSLAALDKPALLSLLMELAKDEATAQRMYTLLPVPSVDHVVSTLHGFEARLRSSLPVASSSAPARDQYVWSRVRSTLDELAAEIAHSASLFSLAPHHARQERPHPAHAFAFLHAATQCVLRCCRMLPADGGAAERTLGKTPLKTYLASLPPTSVARDSLTQATAPLLLREWEAWLTAVGTAVNQEARIYGQEVVLSWHRALQACGPQLAATTRGGTEPALRAAMEQVAHQMHESIGWLIGPAHRPAWGLLGGHGGTAMEE